MSAANSSARVSQTTASAPFLASQKNEDKAVEQTTFVEPLASQETAEQGTSQGLAMAGQGKTYQASQERKEKAVKVKAPQGNGQKSKTVKVNGLTFRVRLSDRGYRVMLLMVEAGRQREPYLVSLRRNEWTAVENDKAALLAKVKEKLRQRIDKASENERDKLQSLLIWISC